MNINEMKCGLRCPRRHEGDLTGRAGASWFSINTGWRGRSSQLVLKALQTQPI